MQLRQLPPHRPLLPLQLRLRVRPALRVAGGLASALLAQLLQQEAIAVLDAEGDTTPLPSAYSDVGRLLLHPVACEDVAALVATPPLILTPVHLVQQSQSRRLRYQAQCAEQVAGLRYPSPRAVHHVEKESELAAQAVLLRAQVLQHGAAQGRDEVQLQQQRIDVRVGQQAVERGEGGAVVLRPVHGVQAVLGQGEGHAGVLGMGWGGVASAEGGAAAAAGEVAEGGEGVGVGGEGGEGGVVGSLRGGGGVADGVEPAQVGDEAGVDGRQGAEGGEEVVGGEVGEEGSIGGGGEEGEGEGGQGGVECEGERGWGGGGHPLHRRRVGVDGGRQQRVGAVVGQALHAPLVQQAGAVAQQQRRAR